MAVGGLAFPSLEVVPTVGDTGLGSRSFLSFLSG